MKTGIQLLDKRLEKITTAKEQFARRQWSSDLDDLKRACQYMTDLANNLHLKNEVVDRLAQIRTKGNIFEAVKELPTYELIDTIDRYSTTAYITDCSMILVRSAIVNKKLAGVGTGELSDSNLMSNIDIHKGHGDDKEFSFKSFDANEVAVIAVFQNDKDEFVINASMLRLLGTAFGTAGKFTFTQRQKHKLISVLLDGKEVAYIMPLQINEDK